MPLRAAGDQSSIEIAELIYRWTEPYLSGDPGKIAVTKAFENAFCSNHPEVAAFFLKNGASVRNVRSGWIKLAKERNWSELLKLFVDAGVSAEEFLDDKKRLASHQLAPTSRDREIQGLLYETLFNFGRLIEIADGLIRQNISDPALRDAALETVRAAIDHKSFLEQRFVDNELRLADPSDFDRWRSLTIHVLRASAISGALNDDAILRLLASVLQMQLFKALSIRLYPTWAL